MEKRKDKPIFVVQEHWASHHHFDFRIEKDGVLKSWAVPKGMPQNEKEKRLAVEVEDHELSYANFEGVIPEGLYGAGKVKIWDKGTYQLVEEDPNKIKFILMGEKLKGVFSLVKIKSVKGKNYWLLIKNKEQQSK